MILKNQRAKLLIVSTVASFCVFLVLFFILSIIEASYVSTYHQGVMHFIINGGTIDTHVLERFYNFKEQAFFGKLISCSLFSGLFFLGSSRSQI